MSQLIAELLTRAAELDLPLVTQEQVQVYTTPLQLVAALDGVFGYSSNPYSGYANDPCGFSRNILGHQPTPGQDQVLEAIRDHKVVVVKSANDVGKTYIAADAAIWFSRCLERSKVITAAAPPLANLQRLLWGEIDRRILDSPQVFAGIKTRSLHFSFSPDWWCDGVAIPVAGSSSEREAKFSGKHAPYLLFIVDEGDAVPDEVYKGIESCMSGGFVRLLVMFNPRAAVGPVYRLIQAGAHVIELDAFSHPNVITGKEVVPGAVSREITVERIARWSRPVVEGEMFSEDDIEYFQVPEILNGEVWTRSDKTQAPALVAGEWRKIEDPQLSYMVLARFPGQDIQQLISRSWIEAAQARWLLRAETHGDLPPEGIMPIHGQDVAEFGSDFNCACFRYGGWVAPFVLWNGIDPLESGHRAAELADDARATTSQVDAIGIGAGVPAAMRQWWQNPAPEGRSCQVEHVAVSVKVSESPTMTRVDEGEFYLLRDQLYWQVREWLRTDPTAMLPPDESLADELIAMRYRYDKGRIRISPKDEMRHLLKRSPDRADSLALTFGPDSGKISLGWG